MNKILFVLAMICGLCISSSVMAQTDKDVSKKIIKGDAITCSCCTRGGAETTSPIILALDLDKDGKISAIELKNATQSLSALDANSDGVISREEMHATSKFTNIKARNATDKSSSQLGVTKRFYVRQMFKNYDKNGNKKLEMEEMPDSMLAALDFIDVNGDHVLTPSELYNVNDSVRNKAPVGQPADETRVRRNR